MTLRFRRVVDHLPSALAIDTKALESVDAHKVLGVTIQSNLKWDLHINEVVAKASKEAAYSTCPQTLRSTTCRPT